MNTFGIGHDNDDVGELSDSYGRMLSGELGIGDDDGLDLFDEDGFDFDDE